MSRKASGLSQLSTNSWRACEERQWLCSSQAAHGPCRPGDGEGGWGPQAQRRERQDPGSATSRVPRPPPGAGTPGDRGCASNKTPAEGGGRDRASRPYMCVYTDRRTQTYTHITNTYTQAGTYRAKQSGATIWAPLGSRGLAVGTRRTRRPASPPSLPPSPVPTRGRSTGSIYLCQVFYIYM